LSALLLTFVRAAAHPPPSDTSWPPALVYFAIFVLLVALGAAYTIFRRARMTTRGHRSRDR